MSTAKSEVTTLLESLPDDASLEDIQYHLYVLEKVKRGVDRAENEGAVLHEEVKQRLSKWCSQSWVTVLKVPRPIKKSLRRPTQEQLT